MKQDVKSLDLLIINAGIISGGKKRYYALGKLPTEDIEKLFRVNSIAPLLLSEKFLPLLEKSPNSKIVNISSYDGSISSKSSSSTYSYDASKAALNMFSKMLAQSLKKRNIAVLALSPDWVRTKIGTKRASLSVEQSVSGMLNIIDNFSLNNTGKIS